MRNTFYSALILVCAFSTFFLFQNATLTNHSLYKTVGQIMAPGGASEQQLSYLDSSGIPHLWIGHSYPGSTAELVDFSPNETNTYPLPNDKDKNGAPLYQGIHSLLLDNETLYISTSPRGVVLSFNIQTKTFTPVTGENVPYLANGAFTWDLVMGPDRVIYGCAYPRATFFKIDLNVIAPKLEVIAKLEEQSVNGARSPYARYLSLGNDGLIYIKTGLTKSSSVLYVFDPKSKTYPNIPVPVNFTEGVEESLIRSFHIYNGKLYARSDLYQQKNSNIQMQHKFVELFNGIATPTSIPITTPSRIDELRSIPGLGSYSKLIDGDEQIKWLPLNQDSETYPYHYLGKGMKIFRLGLGPNNSIYGSTALPAHFFEHTPYGTRILKTIGSGEAYSISSLGDKVLLGVYSGDKAIKIWAPVEGLLKDIKPDPTIAIANGWRTLSSTISIDKKTAWLGSMPSYEQSAGHLVEVSANPETAINVCFPVPNFSISSMETVPGTNTTFLVLGTSILLGTGLESINKSANIQVWDPLNKKIVSKVDLNIPGYYVETFFNFIRLANGSILGMAALKADGINNSSYKYAAFTAKLDSLSGDIKIINNNTLDDFSIHHKVTLNSIALGGKFLYGLYGNGIFAIDPTTLIITKYPYGGAVTSGFLKRGKGFYFGSGANLIRFSFAEEDF